MHERGHTEVRVLAFVVAFDLVMLLWPRILFLLAIGGAAVGIAIWQVLSVGPRRDAEEERSMREQP